VLKKIHVENGCPSRETDSRASAIPSISGVGKIFALKTSITFGIIRLDVKSGTFNE